MPDDVIRIMCPRLTCRRVLAVPTEARGRVVRCKGCGTNIRVPAKLAAPVEPEQPTPGQDEQPAKKAG